MKKISFLGFLFAGLMIVPGAVMAQPGKHHNQVPSECVNHRGEIQCHKHGCERFCDNDNRHDNGKHKGQDMHHNNGHHGTAPVPPPAVRPAPVPPPPAVRPAPVPPPPAAHHNYGKKVEIERQIQSLVAENNRLEDERRRAIREADIAYSYCANLPMAVRNRCTRPDNEIRDIERRMDQNRREIERLKRLQR